MINKKRMIIFVIIFVVAIFNFFLFYIIKKDRNSQSAQEGNDILTTNKKIEDSSSISEEDAKKLVIDYLNKKYNEEFEIETINGNALLYGLGGYDGFSGTAYSKDEKDKVLKFNINNKYEIEDNYYYLIIQEDFEKLVLEAINKSDKNALTKYFGYTHIYADSELNKDVSLQEALSRNLLSPSINLITYTNLNETDLKEIEEELCKINFSGYLRIIVYSQNIYNKAKENDDWFQEYYKDIIKTYRYQFEAGKVLEKKVE